MFSTQARFQCQNANCTFWDSLCCACSRKWKSRYGESLCPCPWKISIRRPDVQDFPCRELRSLVISSHLLTCATKRCGPNCLKLHAICKLLQKVDQHKPPFVWFMQGPRKCRRLLAKIHDGYSVNLLESSRCH